MLLLGKHAERSWGLLTPAHPESAEALHVLSARHPGRQAFIGTPDQREHWQQEQQDVFMRAGAVLRSAVDEQLPQA